MAINKLLPCVKIPYKEVKGNIQERQAKANQLTDLFFKSFEKDIHDDYSIFKFTDIKKKILETLPESFNIMIGTNRGNKYNAYTTYLFDSKTRKICGSALYLTSATKSVITADIPMVAHEFLHISDEIFHPKYLSRAQSLNVKKLFNKKYERLYERYFYCTEDYYSEKGKKEILELVKDRTIRFLKKYNIKDQLDFIQDMRYTLESEIQAYTTEMRIAKAIEDKNLRIHKECLRDLPRKGLFREKIELLKQIGFEIIKQERKEHAKKISTIQ